MVIRIGLSKPKRAAKRFLQAPIKNSPPPPNFFLGDKNDYSNYFFAEKSKNRSRTHKVWPEVAMEILRQNKWQDIEVYKFVKQRYQLHIQQARAAKRAETSWYKESPNLI